MNTSDFENVNLGDEAVNDLGDEAVNDLDDEAVNDTSDFENVNTSDFENVNIGDEAVNDNDEPNLGMDYSEPAVVRVKTLHISSPILAAKSPFFYKVDKHLYIFILYIV